MIDIPPLTIKLKRRQPCMTCGLNDEKIKELVKEQAEDEALWCVNLPGDEANWITIGEAYMQQALRKLHAVIEKEGYE